MSQPLVSIIIPTYNSKHFVKETVASALSQTYRPIEVIVVDDGSSDDTQALFPDFERRGVRCFRIANGGASNARNYGLERASGAYIQFLDADDVLAPTKIEKQLHTMRSHQADLCYSPWLYFKNNLYNITGNQEFRFEYLDHSLLRTGKELMTSYGMDNWFIVTSSWLVKKTLIEQAGFWNPNIINNNDGEYFSRVLFWAKKVVCSNEILFYYRMTPHSLGKLNSISKIDSGFKSYKQVEALLRTCDDVNLMSYPKRMYYMQYKRIKRKFPKEAKRAARNFDRIEGPSFLSKKKYYWFFINKFGLYQGTKIYKLLQPVWRILRKIKT